jgi:precorrin-3B synthase
VSALPKEALRRGWCPSTLRPMETGDGWLVRLHPPGGALVPGQLRRIAKLALEMGNGLVEISARGNLQLRGVTERTHPTLVNALLAEKLVDETKGDGPQRLVLTSPLAGHDPSDLLDADALAQVIETRSRQIAGLPAKICVVVDGGGALALDAFAADLRVIAIDADAVVIGLPQGRWFSPVAPVDAAEIAAKLLLGFAAAHLAAPARIRRMRDLPEIKLAALIATCGLAETQAPAKRPASIRAGLSSLGSSRFAAMIGLPFGRSDAATLARLAADAEAKGVSEIRFSPWRGLAFPGLDQCGAAALLAVADELGLITRDMDPRLSIQACAGAPACLRGETRTMEDAALLAEAAAPLLAAGISLHLSGCVKSCANPGAADLTVVGQAGRYDVVFGGTTRDKPAQRLDLSQIVQRLQPGQDFHSRLMASRASGLRI